MLNCAEDCSSQQFERVEAALPLALSIRRRALRSFFQVFRRTKRRTEQPALRLRKTQVAGANRADIGAGKSGRR
jgi:hypothetical protein